MEKKLETLKEDALREIGRAPAPGTVRRPCGDPTALLGLKAAENALNEEMRLCRDRLAHMKDDYAALAAQLSLTDWLLATLPEESRFLVTARLADRVRWEDLPPRYHARFGIYYSVMTLRRRCAEAVDALCQTSAA